MIKIGQGLPPQKQGLIQLIPKRQDQTLLILQNSNYHRQIKYFKRRGLVKQSWRNTQMSILNN